MYYIVIQLLIFLAFEYSLFFCLGSVFFVKDERAFPAILLFTNRLPNLLIIFLLITVKPFSIIVGIELFENALNSSVTQLTVLSLYHFWVEQELL